MEEIDKDKQIHKEINKLKKIYKDVDNDKKKAVESLIANAAWMAVSLDELRQQIDANGYEEVYTNGANQCGKKDSVAVKTYNTMIKNYNSTIKLLLDQLPQQEQAQTGDKLAQFLIKK